MYKKCTCPSFEGLSYDEIVEVSGLAKRRSESRNCCEHLNYICPTLDKALKEADKKRTTQKYTKSKTTRPRHAKVLTKKRLKL